jgi:AcrR family transcriptional regulator
MESNVPYDRKAEIGRIEELAMTTAALGTADTRTRLIEAAIDLFTRHSFAGTSLQMIADELGFTKAAIYHHFRTREQLLAAVIEPMLDELRAVVESAEAKRTPHARAEHMLSGYAALAVRNRGLVAVLATDPSVATVLTDRAEWGKLILRQLALLADVDPGPAGEFKAAMVFAGMAGAAGPTWGNLDDDALREHLVDAGRRVLGLRTPRRAM